jgi:hypothetical protein
MNETAVRDLLQQAMSGAEPSPDVHILGKAVRAARRTRRRRWAVGLGAIAVIATGLGAGVPAAVGALAPASDHHAGPAAAGHGRSYKIKITVTGPGQVHAAAGPKLPVVFQRPHRMRTHSEVNPVPITDQSVGQLLIDDLPAGVHTDQIQAEANFNATGTAYAYFGNVTSRRGGGLLQATMMPVGAHPVDFGCGAGSSTCHDYHLPGGVVVSEMYQMPTGHGIMLQISVFRPNVTEFTIGEANFAEWAGSPNTKGMPLSVAQLLKIALDGRWQFTISQSFVQQASGLHVVPINTSGS